MLNSKNVKNLHKTCHVESKLYLVCFDRHILNLLFYFNFCIPSLFLVNGPQEIYVNLGCLKCISGMNLSPANKRFFIILFILYLQNRISSAIGNLLKIFSFISKLLNIQLCSLVNLYFFTATNHTLIKPLYFTAL